jgi:hypothetical protein
MSNHIIFTKVLDVSMEYFPKASSSFLPDWYKKTQPYVSNKKEVGNQGTTGGTIKKCIPVFDALTAGYIITTYCDVWVKKNENNKITYITSDSNTRIEFHPIEQAPYHPYMNQHEYPKWLNPWAVTTPKGYSSLFISPVHGGNKYFKIIEGFVDTDKYNAPINFPFVLNDANFEGLIPAGTPIVQVIPIKRESWKIKEGNVKDLARKSDHVTLLASSFFDRYKKFFWQRKDYK